MIYVVFFIFNAFKTCFTSIHLHIYMKINIFHFIIPVMPAAFHRRSESLPLISDISEEAAAAAAFNEGEGVNTHLHHGFIRDILQYLVNEAQPVQC